MIKKYEGFSATCYVCPGGRLTIGYGHVLSEQERFTIITEAQAEELLLHDVSLIEDIIKKNIKVPLTQNQFDALISLIYNWGGGNFLRSNGLKKLNEGDYLGAIEEFKDVRKAAGKVLAGLVKRREAEAALFRTDIA